MRKLYNFWYVFKWVFVKKWYTGRVKYLDHYELSQSRKKRYKETLPKSKLSLGQIEGMIHMIKWFRDRKFYKISDTLRDRLLLTGYHYRLKPIEYFKNFKGNTLQDTIFTSKLFFQLKEGEIYLYGNIQDKNKSINHSGIEITYTTNKNYDNSNLPLDFIIFHNLAI